MMLEVDKLLFSGITTGGFSGSKYFYLDGISVKRNWQWFNRP